MPLAHPDALTPAGFILQLRDFFAEHAQLNPGEPLVIDAQLCSDFADALYEEFEAVAGLESLARAHLLLERYGEAPLPRPGAARRTLARAATPLDAEGRVVLWPVAPAARPGLLPEGRHERSGYPHDGDAP